MTRHNRQASDHDLLLSIDGRTQRLVEDMQDVKEQYVRRDEFTPIKNVVYGLVSVILLSVAGAIVTLVLK